jgi:hypothetical protein
MDSALNDVDAVEFEKEINDLMTRHNASEMQDLENLIADALKRRCYNDGSNRNDRRAAMHMYLRLKNGANARLPAMHRHELVHLVEMVSSSDATDAIIKRLANFYARIAQLRARIEEINSTCGVTTCTNNQTINIGNLIASYAKNEEKRREKHKKTQGELARIMESSIHPDLTEDDLRALEIQVDHIVERGFNAEEMRRLQIIEAAIEQQTCDELIAELNAMNHALCVSKN